MSLRLIIEDFEGDRMVVPLPEDEGPVTLGRAADNHVRLPERNVSRRHAELHPREDGWLLVDADSYNGVLVNGEVVDRDRRLAIGDFIVLADYQLLLGSTQNALEDDVSALTAASQRRKAALQEAMDANESPGLLPASFPSSVPSPASPGAEKLGAAAGSAPAASTSYEADPEPGKSKHVLWVLGAAVAMSVAAFITLNMGREVEGSAQNSDGQEALAAASVRPPEVPARTAPVKAPAASPEPQPSVDPPESAKPAEPTEPPATPEPSGEPANAQPGAQPGTDAPPKSPAPEPVAKPREKTRTPAQAPDPARAQQQAKALMRRARKAAMSGRHQEAMNLARRSFRASASQESLQVLGLSACKVSNRNLAEFAFNRLRRSESRKILIKLCGDAGIDLQ